MEINGKFGNYGEEDLRKWSNKNVVKYSIEIFCVKSSNTKNRILSNFLKFCVFLSIEKKDLKLMKKFHFKYKLLFF